MSKNSSKERTSEKKKITWATLVNINEDQALNEFQKWSFAQKFIEKNSKYGLVKKMLEMGVKILYNVHFGDFIKLLNSKGYIKQGDVIEGINIMLLYAMEKMPGEL